MPEGPEVRRISMMLSLSLTGRRALSIFANRRGGDGEVRDTGIITEVTSHGKHFVISFSGDDSPHLIVHHMLGGRWKNTDFPDGPTLVCRIVLDDGQIWTCVDPMKIATATFSSELPGGIDPIDASEDQILQALKLGRESNPRMSILSFTTRPHGAIVGIGSRLSKIIFPEGGKQVMKSLTDDQLLDFSRRIVGTMKKESP